VDYWCARAAKLICVAACVCGFVRGGVGECGMYVQHYLRLLPHA